MKQKKKDCIILSGCMNLIFVKVVYNAVEKDSTHQIYHKEKSKSNKSRKE